MQRALVIALLFVTSCKKEAPKGDLPPTGGVSGSAAATAKTAPADPPAAAPGAGATPPAAAPDNPHAAAPAPDNPHAAAPAVPPGDMPGGASNSPVPRQTDPRTLEKLPDGSFALGPFSIKPPADWKAKPTTSSMRAAVFELPAPAGAEAELIIFYFGQGGAGSVDGNLNRWLDQIRQPDGKPSRDVAKIEKTKFGGQDASYVSVSGRYVAMAMPGADAADKEGQTLLAAIVDSPTGPYYFKLVGAKATVDKQAAAFRKMLESLKVR
jgi:hypothetical protein